MVNSVSPPKGIALLGTVVGSSSVKPCSVGFCYAAMFAVATALLAGTADAQVAPSFGYSQPTFPNPYNAPQAPTGFVPEEESNAQVGAGVIVGAVFGAVAICGIGLGLWLCCRCRRKNAQQQQQQQQQQGLPVALPANPHQHQQSPQPLQHPPKPTQGGGLYPSAPPVNYLAPQPGSSQLMAPGVPNYSGVGSTQPPPPYPYPQPPAPAQPSGSTAPGLLGTNGAKLLGLGAAAVAGLAAIKVAGTVLNAPSGEDGMEEPSYYGGNSEDYTGAGAGGSLGHYEYLTNQIGSISG